MVKINGKTYQGNNLTMVGNRIVVDGVDVTDKEEVSNKELHVHLTDISGICTVLSDKSIVVHGDVSGDVIAKGSVNCDDVKGNVEADRSVNCDDVHGSVTAGGSVNCDDVGGNVTSKKSVRYDD